MDMASSVARSAAAAMTSASASDGGMDMSGGSGDGPACKISVSVQHRLSSVPLLTPSPRCCGIGTLLMPVSRPPFLLLSKKANRPRQASYQASGT